MALPLLLVALAGAAAAPSGAGCTPDALKRTITACDPAILAEADPRARAVLLHLRASAWNERRRPDKALVDLDEALRLAPDTVESIHERAYTLAELGEFERALADSNRDVLLRPNEPSAYRERGYIRLVTGDLQGAYDDAVAGMRLEPQDWSAPLGQAEAALWLGRFDEAAEQVEAAERLARRSGDDAALESVAERRRVVELWRKRSANPSPAERCKDAFNTAAVGEPDVVGDCTAAFLQATTARAKAEYLTYRSVAWSVGHQDPKRHLTDAEVAAGLDAANADMLVNVAGLYSSVGRHHAAVKRLDRAIAAKPSAIAFAARAAARHGLGDRSGARDDARAANGIRPNVLAFWVLGDLAKEDDNPQEAKRFWLEAVRLGAQDDRLVARLKSVGVTDPAKEAQSE